MFGNYLEEAVKVYTPNPSSIIDPEVDKNSTPVCEMLIFIRTLPSCPLGIRSMEMRQQ